MGTKINPGAHNCYAAALPDEPMFVLLARDESAPVMLRAWSDNRRKRISSSDWTDDTTEDLKKCTEADACADQMTAWRRQNEGRWREGEDKRIAALPPADAEEMALILAATIDAVGSALAIPTNLRGSQLSVEAHEERPWRSSAFHGRRHEIVLSGPRACELTELAPFELSGHIVADVSIGRYQGLLSVVLYAVYD